MKNYNKILEAIDRGILLALDDYDDAEVLPTKKAGKYKEDLPLGRLVNFVDLGLPSGTLWGKYNIGVNELDLVERHKWYGNCYAWGETTPKDNYTWETYKFTKGDSDHLTKYCISKEYGYDMEPETDSFTSNFIDGKHVLEDEDDVATKLLGPKFAIPTKELFDELLKYTRYEWDADYGSLGLSGMIFWSKTVKAHIFLPEGGDFVGNDYCPGCGYGSYWAKDFSPNHNNCTEAYSLYILKGSVNIDNESRYKGYSIRPVYNL